MRVASKSAKTARFVPQQAGVPELNRYEISHRYRLKPSALLMRGYVRNEDRRLDAGRPDSRSHRRQRFLWLEGRPHDY